MSFLSRTRFVFVLSSLAITVLFAAQLNGQVVVTRVTPATTVVRAASPTAAQAAAINAAAAAATGAAATDAAATEATPEKTFDERRIEALLKAKIDRSLPTVLKAWSAKNEDKKEETETVEKKDESLAAKVANIYEDFVVLEFEKTLTFAKDSSIEVRLEEKLVGTVKILSVEGSKVSGKFQAETKAADQAKPVAKPAAEKPAVEKEADAAKEEEAEAKPVAAANSWDVLKAGSAVAVKKPDDGSAKTVQEDAQIKTEVEAWSKIVTLGKWTEVKTFLTTLKEDDADKLYAHLLTRLAAVPGTGNKKSSSSSRREREKPLSNFLSPEDILLITDAAPRPWKVSVVGNKKFKGLGKQVAGKWKGSVTLEGGGIPAGEEVPDIEVTITIALNGGKVSGEILVSMAGQEIQAVEIDGGEYDAKSGNLKFTATKDGSTLDANLIVNDGTMTGTLAAEEDGPTMRFDGEMVEPAEQPAVAEVAKGESKDATVAIANKAKTEVATKGGEVEAKKTPTSGVSHIPTLARLLAKSNTDGFDFSSYIETIKKGDSGIGGQEKDQKLIAADLFLKSAMLDEVEQFLPPLADAIKEEDVISLKMWSQLALSKYRTKQIAKWLSSAWEANMALSANEKSEQAERDAAMANLIELSPKIDREIGEKWLDESFSQSPQRGMKILTNLGTKSSTMARKAASISESERLKLLRLQNGAVEKLLKISPELADEWSDALTMLADTWLKEADIAVKYGSSNSGGGYWDYDQYGNSYWAGDDQYSRRRYGRNDQPQPIRVGDVLEIAPTEQWQKRVRPTLKTQMQRLFASLHLHVNEEDKAFPWIEKVASENPKVAKELVEEFLKIWTRNHDPNKDNRRRNRYVYSYGFDQKADGIPLTRSKQERNLEELQGWINRIRTMKIEELDENLLSNAFTTCHSSAEVYDLERIKSVFGDLGNLKPKTIAAICEKMRANLASNWRNIRNQEEKKTNRRQPEVQQEVLRGYSVASDLAKEALKSSPDNWQLHLSLACLMFDENEYSQTVQKSSEFSDRRDKSYEQFKVAADKYAMNVTELEKNNQKTEVYDRWFYASLGAVDLGKITNRTSPAPKQYPLIREAILALPGTLGDAHMAKFANNMFSRMSPIKPEIKFRYLRGGFAIVEDHPRAWEARGLYDYYHDLVSELKLVAELDGEHKIGTEEPFGVYVNLLHTKEIERESGGFGKYAQNQNSMRYSFNYGRPTEDYRDKFSNAVKQALDEHFEIQSITFQSPEGMQSIPAEQDGWRTTPYAYVLLKARGSEIDRIAPLKLDMDFLDTSGYVVIPIESPALVVDATKSESRPASDLEVTQTLDERQADEGKLIVEVSATAKGLVPPLEQIVNLDRDNFEVVSVDDQGVLPSRFEKDSDAIQILSERSWTVEYRTKDNESKITEFAFADAKAEGAVLKYQRYEDVDLVDAEPTISLERSYSGASWSFLYWLVPVIGLLFFAMAGLIVFLARPKQETAAKFEMPEDVNPFTVLTLLRDIRQRNGISNEKANELEESIREVERDWFGKERGSQENLEELAQTWLEQAS